MDRNAEMKSVLEGGSSFRIEPTTKFISLFLGLVGVITFLAALSMGEAMVAWQALLINTLFFAGVSHAGLMFSVIYTVTDAYWGRPLKRFAEAMASFAPVSLFLFVVLFFGGKYFFEWYNHEHAIYTKAAWLNYPFFTLRNMGMFVVLGILSHLYLKYSLRPDIALSRDLSPGTYSNKSADRLVAGYGAHKEEHAKAYHKNKQLAPWLGFAYGLACTLVAFDWISSIDQEWFSTMFGVQYMVSNLIGAGAALIIISGYTREKFGLQEYLSLERHHDLCKLTFAFTLLWTYMIFSQVIVIWYANLPEETPYLILRMQSVEWGWMFWVIFFGLFQIPFWGLLSRTACRSIVFSRLVAIEILLAVWLEKFFLIVPSMQENAVEEAVRNGEAAKLPGFEILPFIIDLLIGVGMVGIFIFLFLRFLEKFPFAAISDHRFFKVSHH